MLVIHVVLVMSFMWQQSIDELYLLALHLSCSVSDFNWIVTVVFFIVLCNKVAVLLHALVLNNPLLCVGPGYYWMCSRLRPTR